MRLKITHRSEYRYDRPDAYSLQRLRLVPATSDSQRVLDWSVEIGGAVEEAAYSDAFGNATKLISALPGEALLIATAGGVVETLDSAGVSGIHRGYAPLWLFKQDTPLTRAGEAVRSLAADVPTGEMLDRLHALLHLIVDRVAYEKGGLTAATSAEDAARAGKGAAQDQAQIYVSAARALDIPARYVSGYLLSEEGTDATSHAWAEGHVDGLGWVAFDPAYGISPDDRYVRLAVGRDYRDACPVSGFRLGEAPEQLEVRVTVEQ